MLRVEDLGLLYARAADDDAPPRPRPLTFWRKYLADHNGYVPGARGQLVPVDLSPWNDADDRTLLAIRVEWEDPSLLGTTDLDSPAQ